jgi:hypothetical protein
VDKRTEDREIAALAGRLREELRGRTMSRAELDAFCDRTPGVSHWLNMVRVPPAGTWDQRRAHTYGLAEDWVGPLDVDEGDGIEHLVGRYLAAFGPASRDDLAKFTAIPKARLKPILDRMKLRRFLDEAGKELIDVPRGLLPDPETPAPVRFLPTWDATLLVHARRTGLLPERYRQRIFNTRAPHSFPTFLVDGEVTGTWRHEDGGIRLEPFEPLPRGVRRELDDEAEQLAVFHGD